MQKYKEFFTPEEVDTWASKSYSNIALEDFYVDKQPPLSPLSLYTVSISGRINASLRRGALSDSFSHFEGLQYDLGVTTAYIEPGSPWENGFCESFNSRMRDDFLNCELFDTLKEAESLTGKWVLEYNTLRPHSALGYHPPAPQALAFSA